MTACMLAVVVPLSAYVLWALAGMGRMAAEETRRKRDVDDRSSDSF